MNDKRSAEPDGLPAPRRYWAILGMWLALIAVVLDGAVVTLILPTVARDLGVSPAQSIWVLNSFQVAVVVSLLPLAVLGERITFRNVFLVGVGLFAAASVLCFVAENIYQLVAARALQGFGAAGLMSANGALLRYIYPARHLGRGVGLNAMIIATFGAAGPTLAAVVLSAGSWRHLFAIIAAVGIASVIVGSGSFPSSPRSAGRLDVPSVLLNVAAFGLMVASAESLIQGGGSFAQICMLVTGVAAGGCMVARSLSQAHPLLPLDLLRSPNFSFLTATSVGAFAAQMLAFVVLPFFFESELGMSQSEAALHFMVWCIAVALTAPVAGRLSDRCSTSALSGSGLICLSIGLASLAQLPSGAGSESVAWRMALCGIGFGLFQAPNNRSVLMAAPPGRIGAAAGMQALARTTGQILGALGAAYFLGAAIHAWRSALGTGAVLAALGALSSLLRNRLQSVRP